MNIILHVCVKWLELVCGLHRCDKCDFFPCGHGGFKDLGNRFTDLLKGNALSSGCEGEITNKNNFHVTLYRPMTEILLWTQCRCLYLQLQTTVC